jgi:hypothetical protein
MNKFKVDFGGPLSEDIREKRQLKWSDMPVNAVPHAISSPEHF